MSRKEQTKGQWAPQTRADRGQASSTRGLYRFQWNALIEYYGHRKMSGFQEASKLGGMKLVLGGGSHFTATHLQAERKMLLHADTILIPDPVLPWIEVEREAERFKFVNLLQNIFMLLHLKPLVDVELSYPAIWVFPSFEKSLEEKGEETKTGIRN